MTKRNPFWLTRVAALALALSVVTACDDTTAPTLEDVDPEGTAAIVGDIIGSLEGNESLQSYNALGEAMGAVFGGGVPTSFSIDSDAPDLTRELGKLARELASCSLKEPSAVLAGPIIPSEIAGWVFVWNPDLGYVQDPQAPNPFDPGVDAVRFTLYALDLLGVPIVEQVIGYVDFIDTSDATGNKLRTLVTPVEASPVIDYEVSCSFVTGGINVAGSGFITDGTTTVNIDLEVGFSQLSGIAIDFHIDVPTEGVDVDFEATASDPNAFDDEFGTFTAMFQISRNNAIRFNLASTAGSLSGTVQFCDASNTCATAAVISGTFDQPVITDSAGNELPPEAIAALGVLFEGAGAFVDNLFPMLDPAFEICFASG